jgi:hypothetical protein
VALARAGSGEGARWQRARHPVRTAGPDDGPVGHGSSGVDAQSLLLAREYGQLRS